MRHFDKELESASVMQRRYGKSAVGKIEAFMKRMIGSTLHLPLSDTVARVLAENEGELTLEVGSGVRASRSDIVNLDVGLFPNVDVVASGARIPFCDETFGIVTNRAVLEHVREPAEVVEEIYRVLKPGGYVYSEVPFLQHYHAYPNDYQRYTTEGLKVLFAKYEILETGVCVGPCSGITALIADLFELLSFSRNRLWNDALRTIPLALLLPLKYLDRILVKNPRAHEVASGLYVFCRKNG